jgi:hypothetical protein
MKKLLYIAFVYTLLSLFAYGKQQTSSDLILLNGNIFTSDVAQPKAEALAI